MNEIASSQTLLQRLNVEITLLLATSAQNPRGLDLA